MRLADLNHPSQLKGLSARQLYELATEIRQVILETVATTGGHLGPNLGTVELTLALHTVFDSPSDVILWDVSHQSYPHKLVTGRLGRFKTLRQYQGIAGFTHPEESPHDHFHWGHAGTATSAALGVAKARDLRGERFDVIAVVGDGAMTAGMAYEAMNHAGQDRTRLIVVLNDNSMSIAPNVGGISQYLNRIRTQPQYKWVKNEVAEMLKSIPVVGKQAFEWVDRWKESVKSLLLVQNMFFEDLGFTYLGPVDGHDIPLLQETLKAARSEGGPVLVHVVTSKGKGYPYAEEAPDKMHGGGPFDLATGKRLPSAGPTYSSVFGQTMIRLAEDDPRIVAITAAMPDGTGLVKYAQRFPQRFFDVGIAEQHATTFAAGLAKAGMRPVFAVYSTFLQRGYDQLIHDVCVQDLPVVFAIDRGGLVEDGATHQGLFDLAYLRVVPNMVVMAPKDENELQHMLKTAVQWQGPTALRYPRGKAVGVPMDDELRLLPVGKAEVLREGKDLAILALGPHVYFALEAAAELEKEGLQATVVNARFVKPLDEELVLSLAERMPILTVEEAARSGGFGSAVLECLSDAGLTGVHVSRIAIPDQMVPHGNPKIFQVQFGLDATGIMRAAKELSQAAAGKVRRMAAVKRPQAAG